MSILEEIHFTLYHEGNLHAISAVPYLFPAENGIPACFNATLNGKNIGDISCNNSKWESQTIEDTELLCKIGSFITSKYK